MVQGYKTIVLVCLDYSHRSHYRCYTITLKNLRLHEKLTPKARVPNEYTGIY